MGVTGFPRREDRLCRGQALGPLLQQQLVRHTLQLGLILPDDAIALVIGQLHRVLVRQADGVRRQLMDLIYQFGVGALIDLSGLLGSVDFHPTGAPCVRHVDDTSTHVLGVVQALDGKAVVGEEAFLDVVNPQFFVYSHFPFWFC